MAVDPRLLLAGRPTDVGASFGNALLNVQRLEQIQQQRQQQELNQQLQPLRDRLLEAQTTTAEQGVATPTQQLDARNTARLNSIAQFSQQALPALAAGDIEGTRTLLQQRRQGLVESARQGERVDTTEVDEALTLLDSNPKLLAQRMQQSIDAFKQLQAPTGSAGQREFASLTAIVDADPELKTPEGKAAAIKLGLEPRAGISAVERIVDDPELAKLIADFEAKKAGTAESAKLGAQLKLKPEVEAAVGVAIAEVKAGADAIGENRSNKATLTLYDTAMSNLVTALGGTTTGPFVGWLPAVTANAQVAEGAIAAIAPVLKQLFRSAGEGIFTDKDQELLLKMIPTRKTSPAARLSIIQNIDAIVRTKLIQQAVPARGGAATPAADSPAVSATTAPTVLQFDAQGNLVQ